MTVQVAGLNLWGRGTVWERSYRGTCPTMKVSYFVIYYAFLHGFEYQGIFKCISKIKRRDWKFEELSILFWNYMIGSNTQCM